MSFILPVYNEPDFNVEPFLSSPDAELKRVEKDGVAPSGYHATSIYPEYFKLNGKWRLAEESRMDCTVVITDDHRAEITEFRKLKAGDRVVAGRKEDGSGGIYVYTEGFSDAGAKRELFSFRQGRSRETSYSRDYDRLYELLGHERENGSIVWVLGPAVTFDLDSRLALVSMINKGYVHALLAGNALGTHDLEGSLFNTALGQNIYNQVSMPEGHYCHLDVINRARSYRTLEGFISGEHITDGIMHACVDKKVPVVLAGSIRDDGPLPWVISDVYEAQDAMRKYTRKATTVIGLATQLHTIATGNMTPSYCIAGGRVRPVYIYNVDVSEFAVNKLRDRGTLEVTTIVANVQDFLVNLARNMP